jgi:tetratricopeptide (TPR) repeat protein
LEYFSFSLTEQLPSPSELLENIRVLALRAVTRFIMGNLSAAQMDAEKGRHLAETTLSRAWELFLRFLEGRIHFEIGAYQKSVETFQKALAVEALYPLPAARCVCTAWMARAFAYQGSCELAIRLLDDERVESKLFLAEAHYFNQEFDQALAVLRQALALPQPPITFPGEQVIWSHGFASVEGRCFDLLNNDALLKRLIQAFQAYLWGVQGNTEQGVEMLYSITRSEKLPQTDPYLSLYHLFYASILPEVRHREMDDGITVFGKALKLLQQRASRIDDSQVRWNFLNQNLWNARLLEAAKNKNLI